MIRQNFYEQQAQRIETVLHAHKVPARVDSATVSPRFVRYDCMTALGIRLDKIASLSEEIAMSLGVAGARIYRDGGVVRVEVPRQDASTRVLLAELDGKLTGNPANRIPEATALLGLDVDGGPLLLRLDSPDVAHVLISGTTGSGKTALLRTMLASLALHNQPGRLQLALIDPKGYNLAPLAELRHCRALAADPDEIAGLLAGLVADMERRGRQALPHVILAIDELADVVMTVPTAQEALIRLTQRGREAGIHVLAATQRPAAALVGGMVKANFPTRIVGTVVSPEDAKIASGIAGSGAEKLMGRGDFLIFARGGQLRFQAAYVDDVDLVRIIDRLGRSPARRSTPVQPVHRPTENRETPQTPKLTLVATGAPVRPINGHLPRRPAGPTADELAELRLRYETLKSYNRVIDSCGWPKTSQTLAWVKRAVEGQ